jgi:hypothetical protein
MSGDQKHKDKAEAIAEFAEVLMGDVSDADEFEVEDLYQEFSRGKDPATAVRELASQAAQTHRLANRTVPLHVQSALDATGQNDIDSIKPSKLKSIVEQVLRPTRSAVHSAVPAFRNKTEITPRDEEIVKELSVELEKTWEEDDSDERH